ncbi:MAG: DUF1893 domain-containing protein [Lachnospiraceae bacterium]|nr:DUF1893 domain-containing protein [Lachnospiraceae bacterium]
MNKAKTILLKENLTCVLCKDDITYKSTLRGVKPLYQWLKESIDAKDFEAADKVVGKATAYLYVLLKVSTLYARVISRPALVVLKEHNIEVEYEMLVDNIINRKGDGICPFEAAVMTIDNADSAYIKIGEKLKEMGLY